MNIETISNGTALGTELDTIAMAYANANAKGRDAIVDGLAARAMAALDAGDMEEANRWAALRRDVVTAADGVASDYETAARVATFRAALADMEANLSDRARDLVDAGTVGVDERLMARIAGLNVTRTAVSSDGGRRAGSNEAKGNVPAALVRFFDEHATDVWFTTDAISKWVSANCADLGYTEAYPLSTGAISAAGASMVAGKSRSADLIADLEFGPGPKGGANGTVRRIG